MRIFGIKALASGLAGLILLACSPVSAMASEDETPSGIALDDVGSSIEAWAQEHEDEYPSFAVAVIDGDEMVYSGAFGYIDAENGIEATPDDTVYEWGSITKTLVWVSVMQLWEQGRIDLNEDIRNYLPDGYFHKLQYDDPITMLNLMNHNAGWCEPVWAFQVSNEGDVMGLEESLQYSEPVQIYRPGEVSSYSNYGAAVAGYVVECITGQPFWEYVHENIFEPLGMEHTAIKPAHDDCQWVYERRQQFVSYYDSGDGWVSQGSQLYFIIPYPAGATCGSVEDLARYCSAFVSEDNPLFENEFTRDELLSATMYCGDTDIPMCCHGFWKSDYEGVTTLGHNGGTNGGSSNLEFDPVSGVGVVTLINGSGSSAHSAMAELIFGGPVNEAPEIYGGDYTEADISGIYISARAMRRGPMRFMSLLGLMPVIRTAEDEYDVMGLYSVSRIGEDVYFISDDSIGIAGMVRTLDDGTKVLNLPSAAYVTEKGLFVELALLVIYILCVVVTMILLVIKLIKLIAKKYKTYPGARFITAAQVAKLISVGVIISWMSVYAQQYGIYKPQGVIGCLIEMVCFALCLLSIGASVKALASGAKGKFKYIVNIIANVLFATAMIVFELMVFWGV
ncbi:MAG: serine hydrolase [Clostridiales bacterium]|nr:serine hydrolase [Clostridiales bacterium]